MGESCIAMGLVARVRSHLPRRLSQHAGLISPCSRDVKRHWPCHPAFLPRPRHPRQLASVLHGRESSMRCCIDSAAEFARVSSPVSYCLPRNCALPSPHGPTVLMNCSIGDPCCSDYQLRGTGNRSFRGTAHVLCACLRPQRLGRYLELTDTSPLHGKASFANRGCS
jgi:hypothetical protein